MNILLLNRSYHPNFGGIENSLYCISRELVSIGHSVTIYTEQPRQLFTKRKEFADIFYYQHTTIPKLFLPFYPFFNYQKVIKNIVAAKDSFNQYDLIISRDPILAMAFLCVLSQIKLIYIPAVVIKYYNVCPRKLPWNIKQLKAWIRYMQLKLEDIYQQKTFKNCEAVVVFSQNVKTQVLSAVQISETKIFIQSPGYSDKFTNKTILEDIPQKCTFLFVGRLVPEKNLSMMIEAFSQLKHSDCNLIIVGEGENHKDLVQLVKCLHLESRVIFTGYRDDTENYYPDAQFLVIPSEYEAFGQVIIEAFACGTPAIGFSNQCGMVKTATDELIIDGNTGFICNEFSVQSLRDTLEKAISFSKCKLYINMRKACFSYCQDNFSWEKFVQKLIDIGGKR